MDKKGNMAIIDVIEVVTSMKASTKEDFSRIKPEIDKMSRNAAADTSEFMKKVERSLKRTAIVRV